jgi:capsid assembly protease
MSKRNRKRAPRAQETTVDLRASARALLADPALAIRREVLDRIVAIARSDAPVVATVPSAEAEAALGRGPRSRNVRAGVAVVPLQGIITPQGSWLSLLFGGGPGGLQGFRQELREAVNDDDVDAIVLDVHSPGGQIGLVPETAAELRAARGTKPIVAVANTMTASAAYWIAAQADEVVVTPSGFLGSIGVYLVHEDWSGWNAEAGIAPTYIYAGRYKVEANMDEPLGATARAALQAEVDYLYGLFVADVAAGRGVDEATVRSGYGEARVLPAEPAVAADLGDRVATIDDVITELANGDRPAGRAAATSARASKLPTGDNPDAQRERELAEEARARIAELQTLTPVV